MSSTSLMLNDIFHYLVSQSRRGVPRGKEGGILLSLSVTILGEQHSGHTADVGFLGGLNFPLVDPMSTLPFCSFRIQERNFHGKSCTTPRRNKEKIYGTQPLI